MRRSLVDGVQFGASWLVGIVAVGEGWHNNHHADQRSASHGHKWWEWDATFWVIRALKLVGLVSDVVPPRAAHQTTTEPHGPPKATSPGGKE